MAKTIEIYGLHTVQALLQSKPFLIKRLLLLRSAEDGRLQVLAKQAKAHSISIEWTVRARLQDCVGEAVNHQGVVALCAGLPSYQEKDLTEIIEKAVRAPLFLVLDGVQDPHNLGACLRTANAMGVDAVIAPRDRAVGLTPVARKVACGADSITPFIQVTNLARCLRDLKKQGIWLVGAAADAEQALHQVDLKVATAIVLGSEGGGLRRLTQENCDYVAAIPLLGTVGSVNVSVAAGMFLYEASRQRIISGT